MLITLSAKRVNVTVLVIVLMYQFFVMSFFFTSKGGEW